MNEEWQSILHANDAELISAWLSKHKPSRAANTLDPVRRNAFGHPINPGVRGLKIRAHRRRMLAWANRELAAE